MPPDHPSGMLKPGVMWDLLAAASGRLSPSREDLAVEFCRQVGFEQSKLVSGMAPLIPSEHPPHLRVHLLTGVALAGVQLSPHNTLLYVGTSPPPWGGSC